MSLVTSPGSSVEGPSGGTVADVVGLILEKGLVIDVYARVSLVGIEILTLDARVVVASVDTYLRFAEKANRLNLEATRKPGLPELVGGVVGGVVGGAPKAQAMPAAEDRPQIPAAPVVGGHHNGQSKAPRRVRSHARKENGR